MDGESEFLQRTGALITTGRKPKKRTRRFSNHAHSHIVNLSSISVIVVICLLFGPAKVKVRVRPTMERRRYLCCFTFTIFMLRYYDIRYYAFTVFPMTIFTLFHYVQQEGGVIVKIPHFRNNVHLWQPFSGSFMPLYCLLQTP